MITKSRALFSSLSFAGLALGCIIAHSARADGFETSSAGLAKKLEKSFGVRTAGTCAPVAPIETKFIFADTPRIGLPVQIHFEVMTLEKGVDATVRFDTPGVDMQGPIT